jgi:5'-3' exonuclease
MINSKGADMSILFGFTKYILELIEREKPTHMAIAFDPPGGTFRHEIYPEYKGTRSETPQLIIDSLEPLCELCKALDLPVLMVKGFEADDVIGSMAKRAEGDGFDVFMVTPDKDYGQLISDRIFQYKPGRSGGEDEIIDKEMTLKKGQKLKFKILPGHQSDMMNNIYVVTTEEKKTVVQTGDQYHKEDINWIMNIHQEIPRPDALLVNCWTHRMNDLVEGFAPKYIITGHENEMGHTIDHREAFWLTFQKMEEIKRDYVVMGWGEWFLCK